MDGWNRCTDLRQIHMEDVFGPSIKRVGICQGQKSKVKVTSDKKRVVHSQHPAVWTKWNGLAVDNVAQAAGASI